MNILYYVFILIFLSFTLVIFFGAPYLPTRRKQINDALDLLSLKKGQVLLELGSGDGSVILEAAKRGIRCNAYEINPLLVIISRFRCRKYRQLVNIKWANYWGENWPKADGIYVFLLEKYMKKLDNKFIQYFKTNSHFKVVSYGFEIPDKKPQRTKGALFLYKY